MNQKNKKVTRFPMVAKTLSGLEDILASELKALGANKVRTHIRSVEFEGDTKLLYNANLWCRTATRILKPIYSFRAIDGDQLYNQIDKIDWTNIFGAQHTFLIDAVVNHSKMENSLFVAQRTKDAIADQFRRRFNKRPSVDKKNPQFRISVHIIKNETTVALDSSGEPLNKRGYRTGRVEAPLNEVLASGILYLSDWDKNCSFIDPMCGSGTFVIEAAMMARNIAPGLNRKSFCFQNWKDYDTKLFGYLRNSARKVIKPSLDFEMVASDIDSHAVKETIANARRAGVERDIQFERKAIEYKTPPPAPGMVIVNPPYGERIKIEDITTHYKTIGDSFKQNYSGYNAFIFSGNLKAIKSVGLRTSQKIKLFNGPLECRLLKYEMYKGSHKKSSETSS